MGNRILGQPNWRQVAEAAKHRQAPASLPCSDFYSLHLASGFARAPAGPRGLATRGRPRTGRIIPQIRRGERGPVSAFA